MIPLAAGLQCNVLTKALSNLKKSLLKAQRNEAAFLKLYTTVRQHAFEVEMLAKFYRKAGANDKKYWIEIQFCTKGLEDRLGAFGEVVEMVDYCETHDIHLSGKLTGAAVFNKMQSRAYLELKRWMKSEGWTNSSAHKKLCRAFASIHWLDDKAIRKYCRQRLESVMVKLQRNIDCGKYDSRRRSGYEFREVEFKVHELRREVRLVAQYITYVGGIFALTNRFPGATGQEHKTLKRYASLLKTKLVKSPFARLPKARIKKPLPISQALFLLINRLVEELGRAKDWPQRLERLRRVGFGGQINLNQLEPELRDWNGVTSSFNKIVNGSLNEMRERQIFAVMAGLLARGADHG